MAGSPAAGQVLTGTVVDSVSGRPLPGTRVSAYTADHAKVGDTLTGSDGAFTFHLPAVGVYVLLIRRIGYAMAHSLSIDVRAGVESTVRFELQPAAVPLDTIAVVGDTGLARGPVRWLADVGFYGRRSKGFGYFLTRDDIDKKDPLTVSDLLKGIPGIRVSCGSPLSCTITMPAATSMFIGKRCAPTVVLDGAVVTVGGSGGTGNLDWFNPFNLEAIEIYPSPAGVPVQYAGYMSPCGAVLLWSRR